MHLSAIVASILIFNEDNTHFLRDVPEVEFVRYFDSVCRPGGVTHFFMCPNAMRSNIDTRSLEPIWTALGEQGVNPAWGKTAKALHDKGIDPYAIWTRRAREKGVSPWLSIRMNDIHEVHDPAFGGLSTMWRNHPEYRIDPKYSGRNWDPHAFSYTNAAVREVYSAYAKELLERYDVDGIEFDWLRFPSLVEKGRGERDAHYITEFMRMARPHVKAAEKLYAGDPPKTGHVEVHVAYDREVPLGLAITLNGVSPSSCHAEDGRDWLYPTAIATNAVSYAFPIHAARRGYNEIAFPAEPVLKTVVVAAELRIIPNGGKKR